MDDILPPETEIAANDPIPNDFLVDAISGESKPGKVISERHDLKFELLSDTGGHVLALHSEDGVVGCYIGDTVVVRDSWTGKGLGVALILFAYDHGKSPALSRKFTRSGAKTMTKAMSVASGDLENPFWP